MTLEFWDKENPILSENAKVILKERYLLKNEQGEVIENPQEMFERVAVAVAEGDSIYGATKNEVIDTAKSFYDIMAKLEFLPNSPTLMNAMTKSGTLSACFVLPLKDSMEGIMEAATSSAMVQKYGGGTGFALSELRPKNSRISSTHGKACGPIAVLKLLSEVSTMITQGGKRDGANMAVMNVRHPDIMEFIDCKMTEGDLHNFNISVAVDEDFMYAVKEEKDYSLKFPVDSANPDHIMGTLKAKEVFNKMVTNAWRNGEPGMIFLDRINEENPVSHIGNIIATNPCGEQPLLPNESCNLGSINLSKFVKDGKINWTRLEHVIKLAVHFLDNVIDVNKYATPEIEKATKATRKIGLGVMGFADYLIKREIPYDSEEALGAAYILMNFIQGIADEESEKLGGERGLYPACKEDPLVYRNACRLTVAPTGSISMIADCSSGIEPIFALAYEKKNILGGKSLNYINEDFKKHVEFYYPLEANSILDIKGTIQNVEVFNELSDGAKKLFKTAVDISPQQHVAMQSVFQEFIDSGVSKTINLPFIATEQDINDVFLSAWQKKCKGITVYRNGSREKEVLVAKNEELPKSNKGKYGQRPKKLNGSTYRVLTSRGNIYVTINTEDGNILEVFTTHGRAGGNDSAMAEAISRLISLSLRNKILPAHVIEQLEGITDDPIWDQGILIKSVPDAIAHALKEELGIVTLSLVANTEDCPACKNRGTYVSEDGCFKCYSCGFSKC